MLVLTSGCGRAERPGEATAPRDLPSELKGGRWSPTPPNAPGHDLTAEQLAEIERLEAVGYAAGVRSAPGVESVTVHDRQRAHQGLNLYTSGHGTEAVLMNMDGEVLHRWSFDYDRLWPELDVPAEALGRGKWRRAYLYPNGDLLAIHEAIGLIKLDKESRLLWEYPGRAHHDLHVMPDGTIWVLTRHVGIIPRINETKPAVDDFIVHLDVDGREIDRISLLESLESAAASELLDRIPEEGILLHTNSLEPLDDRLEQRLPAFAPGSFLVSFRELDAIAVIDFEEAKLTWSLSGEFEAQHHPTVLDNGNLLLFDNLGLANGASAVYELRPETGEIVWEYRGTTAEPFFSWCCGTAYRLPNGNTLITETDGGRAFEVVPDGEIVWEYYNPHRAGESLEYIASLYDLQRLPQDFAAAWLRSAN